MNSSDEQPDQEYSSLSINLTLRNTTAFTALVFVLHEFHEIAHTAIGRIICGCWGERNFNNWSLCGDCGEMTLSILASFAGPVFTYAMMYAGYYYLSERFNHNHRKNALGFAFILGALPAARIITALMGKGDELMELKIMFGDYLGNSVLWFLAIVLVTAIAFPPLYRSWNVLARSQRLWGFTGFFLLPFIFDVAVVIIGMNTLHRQGFLDQPGIIGSPLIVNLWTLLWIIVLVYNWKSLQTILQPLQGADHNR